MSDDSRSGPTSANPAGTGSSEADAGELASLRARAAELESQLEQARGGPTAPEVAAPGPRRRSGWWRTVVAAVLVAVAALLAPAAVVASWAHDVVGNTDRYVQTVGPLAHDPAVQDAVVERITREVFSRLDVEAVTREAVAALADQGLPPAAVTSLNALTVPLAEGIRSFITDRVEEVVRSPEFADAWVQANRQGHVQVVAVLTGEGTETLTVEGGTVSIDLGAVIEIVKEQLAAVGFTLVEAIPTVNAQFTVVESDTLVTAQRGFRALSSAARWLPVLGLLALAGAVYVARRRRQALIAGSLAVAGSMLLLGIGLNVFRAVYLDAVPPDQLSPAAAASVYDAFVGFMRLSLRAVLVVGLAVAVGAWFAGPSPSAVATRRGVTNAVAALRGGTGLSTGRVGAFVYRYRPPLRAVVVGAAVLVYAVAPNPTGGWTLWLLTIMVVALLVVEFLAQPAAESGATPTDRAGPGPPPRPGAPA